MNDINTNPTTVQTTLVGPRNQSYDKYKLRPFLYSLETIQWDLFLTIHYKGYEYNADTEFAEKNRSNLIFTVIKLTKGSLGLNRNDIQYFGVTEKRQGRCHTHTLIYIKEKAGPIVALVRDTINSLLPLNIVTFPENSTKNRANQIVNDPEKVSAYITKLNRNDTDIPKIHFSEKYVKLANSIQRQRIMCPSKIPAYS